VVSQTGNYSTYRILNKCRASHVWFMKLEIANLFHNWGVRRWLVKWGFIHSYERYSG